MPRNSYSHGASAIPLLGETIGENLRRSVERFPEREALVVRHQNYRATLSSRPAPLICWSGERRPTWAGPAQSRPIATGGKSCRAATFRTP
jgi:hypothetical protein